MSINIFEILRDIKPKKKETCACKICYERIGIVDRTNQLLKDLGSPVRIEQWEVLTESKKEQITHAVEGARTASQKSTAKVCAF